MPASSMLRRAAGPVSTVAVGLLAAACSGGGGNGFPLDMTALLPDMTAVDLKDQSYPPGPYGDPRNGIAVGETIPDLTFMGYFAPTQTNGLSSASAFREVTLGMIHDTGARFMMLEIGAFY